MTAGDTRQKWPYMMDFRVLQSPGIAGQGFLHQLSTSYMLVLKDIGILQPSEVISVIMVWLLKVTQM
jgi:hypothetical protein